MAGKQRNIKRSPMIVVIASVKGGTGKTTIATNLAVMRACNASDVLLVDCDDQKSSSDFAAVREEEKHSPPLTCVFLTGRTAGEEIRKLTNRFDDIVIDVGGRDSTTFRSVLLYADVLVVPFLPSQIDIWALDTMNTLVGNALELNPNLRTVCFMNKVDTNPRVELSEDATSLAKECTNLTFKDIPVGYRVSFRRCVAEGLSVIEYKGKREEKAKSEITKLYEDVFNEEETN